MIMATRVTLTVVQGEPLGREYVFSGRTVGAVGRAEDCLIRLSNGLLHQNISRHHFLLDIDSPEIRVRDLGSRNGTFVNGVFIGKRPRETASPDAQITFPTWRVHEGDEIRIGDTVFRVTTSHWDEDTEQDLEGAEFTEALNV
jgi:pSer/pThr/pTyr-binding forkhead associated (FHA) protein